jgi:hypothetical protein
MRKHSPAHDRELSQRTCQIAKHQPKTMEEWRWITENIMLSQPHAVSNKVAVINLSNEVGAQASGGGLAHNLSLLDPPNSGA